MKHLCRTKKLVLITLIILSSFLTACSTQKEIYQVSVAVAPYEILREAFLEKALETYKDDIGVSRSGERIVEKLKTKEGYEYSVYEFDEEGYTHKYYYIAYSSVDHSYNCGERLRDIPINEDTIVTDNNNHVIKFSLEYVRMGNNAYNYFRNIIESDFRAEKIRLGLKDEDTIEAIVKEEGIYSIVGELSEYVEEVTSNVYVDEDGLTVCDSSERCFICTDNGDGTVSIVGYSGTDVGQKLILPESVGGKTVSKVYQLEPVPGVEVVVVSESVQELCDSFKNWYDLKHIQLKEGVQKISIQTFKGTSVMELALPDTITELDDFFFKELDVSAVAKIPAGMKSLNGCFKESNVVNVIIPGTISEVEALAFENCRQLSVVYVEQGVVAIKEQAFKGCNSLQAVAIPSSVEFIGIDAFPNGTLIMGKSGSYAELYAKQKNLPFAVEGS